MVFRGYLGLGPPPLPPPPPPEVGLPLFVTLYVWVTGSAVFPVASVAVTVNVLVPSVLVSMGDPLGTSPVHESLGVNLAG